MFYICKDTCVSKTMYVCKEIFEEELLDDALYTAINATSQNNYDTYVYNEQGSLLFIAHTDDSISFIDESVIIQLKNMGVEFN